MWPSPRCSRITVSAWNSDQVRLLGPGQVGVRGRQRSAGGGAAGGRAAGELGGLRHGVGGEQVVTEQPTPGRRDASVARRHHVGGVGGVPGGGEEVRDERRG